MQQIHLIHKEHGFKIAYQTKEAQADMANGWRHVSAEDYYAELDKHIEHNRPQDATEDGQPKRRGRPAKVSNGDG